MDFLSRSGRVRFIISLILNGVTPSANQYILYKVKAGFMNIKSTVMLHVSKILIQ